MQDQKNQEGVCCHYVKEQGRDYKTKADTQQHYQPLVFCFPLCVFIVSAQIVTVQE
jgi:hypothetical protein